MTDILVRKRHMETHRKESHVTVEAEIAVMYLQAKECQEFQGALKS